MLFTTDCFRFYVQTKCSTNEDCYPADYHLNNITVPPRLISCDISTGLCLCQECFVRLKDICQVNSKTCEEFDDLNQQCTDNRRSQKTALLLSAFLSATGAANFYIKQNTLGKSKLLCVYWLSLCLYLYTYCG